MQINVTKTQIEIGKDQPKIKKMDPRKPGVLDKLGLVHKGIFVPMIGTEIKIFGCTKNISMLFGH